MKTLDLIPEEVVSDFGIKDYIEDNLLEIINKLGNYEEENRVEEMPEFIHEILQLNSYTPHWDSAVKKYSERVDFPVVCNLSKYVFEYIRGSASKRGFPIEGIALTYNSIS